MSEAFDLVAGLIEDFHHLPQFCLRYQINKLVYFLIISLF